LPSDREILTDSQTISINTDWSNMTYAGLSLVGWQECDVRWTCAVRAG